MISADHCGFNVPVGSGTSAIPFALGYRASPFSGRWGSVVTFAVARHRVCNGDKASWSVSGESATWRPRVAFVGRMFFVLLAAWIFNTRSHLKLIGWQWVLSHLKMIFFIELYTIAVASIGIR